MTNNSSLHAGNPLDGPNDDRVILVQVLIAVFLFVNIMLIITFFMKEIFYTNMRYILFANALFSDCINLIVTNILLILIYFELDIHSLCCLLLYIVSSLYNFVTPLTLTAMSLERYVAICKPLHHSELCTTQRALQGILIIHSLGILPFIVIISLFLSSVTFGFFKQYILCSVELFILQKWHGHLRSAISQFYFLIMGIIIALSYVQIMRAAKAASGKNKDSTGRALRTVILHAFQLLLCLILLWSPFIEAAVFQIDLNMYKNLRYFMYICFNLTPRCLNPLIYGLRDEAFVLALKQWVFRCPLKNNIKQ